MTAQEGAASALSETDARSARRWGVAVLAYTAAYLVWLWFTREPELLHWVTLVLVPLGAIAGVDRRHRGRTSLPSAPAAVGLRRGNLRTRVGPTAALGLAVGAAELALSGQGSVLADRLGTRPLLWVFLPLAFAFLLLTAGVTEEFFFRGLLQERLTRWWGTTPALVTASLVFGLYHFPYRYLTPRNGGHGERAQRAPGLRSGGDHEARRRRHLSRRPPQPARLHRLPRRAQHAARPADDQDGLSSPDRRRPSRDDRAIPSAGDGERLIS